MDEILVNSDDEIAKEIEVIKKNIQPAKVSQPKLDPSTLFLPPSKPAKNPILNALFDDMYDFEPSPINS